MDEFLNYVQNHFSFLDAVVLKNLFIALGFFVLGMFFEQLFVSWINSKLVKDNENKYKLDELGISMLIINVRGKEKIVTPPGAGMGESFFCIFIISLYKIGILKGPRIEKRDRRIALVVFILYLFISFIIIFIALLLILTVQTPGHPYKFTEIITEFFSK